MRFVETELQDVWILEPEPIEDVRGDFARTFAAEEFAARGLDPRVAQCNTSFNRKRGTIRGMHFQSPPHQEAKLVRCTRGAIFDVALDLRPGSGTFRRWVGVELTGRGRRMLYVPEGCAHGFQTLEDGCEVFYQMSQPYHAVSAGGVLWNDPAFGIEWPLPLSVISDRDRGWPPAGG